MKLEKIIKEKIIMLLEHLEVSFDKLNVSFIKEKEQYRINIESDEPSLLIGHHGETIGAIQHLLKVLLWKEDGEEFNISVDVDNYRQRQEENVIEMIKRKIDAVRETNQEQRFPPMSPYFRRQVHLYISEHNDLISESQGDGDHRYVIIRLK